MGSQMANPPGVAQAKVKVMSDRIEQLSQSTFLTGKFLGKDFLDKFIHCLIFVVDDPSESIVKGFTRCALIHFFKGRAKSRIFHG